VDALTDLKYFLIERTTFGTLVERALRDLGGSADLWLLSRLCQLWSLDCRCRCRSRVCGNPGASPLLWLTSFLGDLCERECFSGGIKISSNYESGSERSQL